MNANAKLWMSALRNGEYEQGQLRLCWVVEGVDRFCCLGVACELAVKAGIIRRNESHLPGGVSYGPSDSPSDAVPFSETRTVDLPTAVQTWLGLRNNSGTLPDEAQPFEGHEFSRSVMGLNDVELLSFPQIADAIESREADLFVKDPA